MPPLSQIKRQDDRQSNAHLRPGSRRMYGSEVLALVDEVATPKAYELLQSLQDITTLHGPEPVDVLPADERLALHWLLGYCWSQGYGIADKAPERRSDGAAISQACADWPELVAERVEVGCLGVAARRACHRELAWTVLPSPRPWPLLARETVGTPTTPGACGWVAHIRPPHMVQQVTGQAPSQRDRPQPQAVNGDADPGRIAVSLGHARAPVPIIQSLNRSGERPAGRGARPLSVYEVTGLVRVRVPGSPLRRVGPWWPRRPENGRG